MSEFYWFYKISKIPSCLYLHSTTVLPGRSDMVRFIVWNSATLQGSSLRRDLIIDWRCPSHLIISILESYSKSILRHFVFANCTFCCTSDNLWQYLCCEQWTIYAEGSEFGHLLILQQCSQLFWGHGSEIESHLERHHNCPLADLLEGGEYVYFIFSTG